MVTDASVVPPRATLRQNPRRMLGAVRFGGFANEEQLQASTRAFNRARGHAAGMDYQRFRDTFVREASAGMPHELSERLFTMWNRSKTGELSLDEFLAGIALVTNGSREDHVQFVFELIRNSSVSVSISRDDTTAFLRFFGPPSTSIATFKHPSAVDGRMTSSSASVSSYSSCSIVEFCSSFHPSSSSTRTAEDWVRLLSSDKWQNAESLIIVDWLRDIGNRLLSAFAIDQSVDHPFPRDDRITASSSLESCQPLVPAQSAVSDSDGAQQCRLWVLSRRERDAIRRELDALMEAPCDEGDAIKCGRSVPSVGKISEAYAKATKDHQLVQTILEWSRYLDAVGDRPTTSAASSDVSHRCREQHKRLVLGLCCAQSWSVLQVYRSLFALFDGDSRGRLTQSDLADFLFVMTPHCRRDESERAACEAMSSFALSTAASPPPSPERSKQRSSTIMTFMQFVDMAKQQGGLSSPEVEVSLLFYHLHTAISLPATDHCSGGTGSLVNLLQELHAFNAPNEVRESRPSGFYMCEESQWRQIIKQICKCSYATTESSSHSHSAKELAQIMSDAAVNTTSTLVVIPLHIWMTVAFWVAHISTSGKPSLDWRRWLSEMTSVLAAPPVCHVSVSLISAADELAWSTIVQLPYAIVAKECTIRSIVDASCSISGWTGKEKQSAEGISAPPKNYNCHLSRFGTEGSGLQISTDLLDMPLSALIHNITLHDTGNDGAPTLTLKVTESENSSTPNNESPDSTLLANHVSLTKPTELWTTPRGLINLGNTCFMNSALQSLAATPLLREYFRQGEFELDGTTPKSQSHKHVLSLKRETPPPSLTHVFSQLLDKMTSVSLSVEKGSITPTKMYSTLGTLFPHMCDGTQQDAQEFISSFVSRLGEELKREPALSHESEESVLSPQSRTILSLISTRHEASPGSPGASRRDSRELQKISPRDSDGRHDRIVAMEWWVSHLINEPSVITCFFSGQFKSVLTCSACGNKSTRFEPFSSLQLPITNQERKSADALDVTTVVHFADSPRFRRPRRFVIPASNDWTVHDLLLRIARDHLASSGRQKNPVLAAVAIDGSLIQDIYDEDMLLVTVPTPIHVMELDSSPISSVPTIAMSQDPYGSALTARTGGIPGDDVLVKISTDRLVKGVVIAAHTQTQAMPSSYDVLLVEGVANGRTIRHASNVVARAATTCRALYLRCIHRHSVVAPFYCASAERQVVSGSPFMIRVAAGLLTGPSLYSAVAKRFFGHSAAASPHRSSRESGAANWRFTLRRVSDDGKNCGRCHWIRNCRGCLLDDTSSELLALDMDETIAIDWDDNITRTARKIDGSGASAVPYDPVPIEDDESYRSHRAQHSQSIADSLAMLCSEEALDARCSACQKQQQQQQQQQQSAPYTPHTKRLSIWSVPPVLVLQLKRFELAVGAQGEYSWHKLSDRVDFPVRGLSLSAFLSDVDGAHSDEAECSQRCTEVLDARVLRGMAYLQDELGLPLDSASRSCAAYDLYAVIHHSGELNSGHYTAVVRQPEDAASDHWWLADDATVSSADPSQLAPSATAYVLFYVRRDIATSAGDLVSASLGAFEARSGRFRRPREFFPRRPSCDDGQSSAARSRQPPKRRRELHEHERREERAARDDRLCVVM